MSSPNSILEQEIERLYHRSGRMLGLNSPESLQDCQQLLGVLVENILKDPTNEKFHKIKLSNSAIQNRIVGRPGTCTCYAILCDSLTHLIIRLPGVPRCCRVQEQRN